ncbi:hypothetical protein ACX80O_15900, partial [Arthrobacter sp. Hz1]
KTTTQHHKMASCSQIQPINKTIGINKHGTLLSSQTTGAIRGSCKYTFYLHFLAATYLKLFHPHSLCQIRAISGFRQKQPNEPTKSSGESGFCAEHTPDYLMNFRRGWLPLNGGNSENITRGSGSAQIPLRGPRFARSGR